MSGYKTWISVAVGTLFIGSGANLALADTTETETPEKIATEASVTVGYRGVGTDDKPNRALEYDSLESSPLFNARIFTDQGFYHLDLGADFLNEDDYSAEAHLGTKGLLGLDLRSERFFHNLDHIPYDNGSSGPPTSRSRTGSPTDGSRRDGYFPPAPVTGAEDITGATTTVPSAIRPYYTDWNPGDRYGLQLDVNEVKLKIKFPDYPAHINLSYWRYEKSGERQLRFGAEGGDSKGCTGCHMQSRTRNVDRVTEELKAEIDTHAGFVDVALETLYRTFHDRENTPVDAFGVHTRGRTFGDYAHDEDPDSRLMETTLRLNTAPSGGLVGSASFTIGERENRSDLDSVTPVKAETDYFKTTADFTYTPGENWTFNFRYRLFDMDSDNPEALTAYGSTNPNPLDVREAMDITRAWYEAIVNYRPSKHLILKGEFRREEIDRSNTGPMEPLVSSATLPIAINPNWELPDEEVITRVKLGFNSRLLEKSALKLNGWAALQRTDDPAYGTSFAESRELFLAANYALAANWGLAASVNLLDEANNAREVYQFNELDQLQGYDLDRQRRQQNVSVGSWLNLNKALSFDFNYGYLRTAIDQDLLFGAEPDSANPLRDYTIEDEGVDYRQTVHTLSAGMTWQARENLSCRFEGYHIRSKASYSPNFPEQTFEYAYRTGSPSTTYYFPATASSSDLHEISELDIRQNGVRGRVNWKIDENWSCGVEASYDKYAEGGNDVYDGSVQTCMVSFSRTW